MQRTVLNKTMYLSKFKVATSTQLMLISLCFIILFGYTGIHKISDTSLFQGQMSKSKLLAPYVKILSYVVPIIELIIAVLLAVPNLNKNKNKVMITTKIGLWASLVLMFVFTAYVAYTLIAFSNNPPCTCGGIMKNLSWKEHLIVNLSFLLLATWSIFLMRKQKKLSDNIDTQ